MPCTHFCILSHCRFSRIFLKLRYAVVELTSVSDELVLFVIRSIYYSDKCKFHWFSGVTARQGCPQDVKSQDPRRSKKTVKTETTSLLQGNVIEEKGCFDKQPWVMILRAQPLQCSASFV